MPPDGYSTVTISDDDAEQIARLMAIHDLSSYADAVKYAVETTLIHEDEITVQQLVQLLAVRLDELAESDLP